MEDELTHEVNVRVDRLEQATTTTVEECNLVVDLNLSDNEPASQASAVSSTSGSAHQTVRMSTGSRRRAAPSDADGATTARQPRRE